MSLLSPEDLAACEAVTASSSLIANRIIDAVAQHAGISRAQIIGPDRSERIARAMRLRTANDTVTTRRALEIILSRCKLNPEAELSLKYLLAGECQRGER